MCVCVWTVAQGDGENILYVLVYSYLPLQYKIFTPSTQKETNNKDSCIQISETVCIDFSLMLYLLYKVVFQIKSQTILHMLICWIKGCKDCEHNNSYSLHYSVWKVCVCGANAELLHNQFSNQNDSMQGQFMRRYVKLLPGI